MKVLKPFVRLGKRFCFGDPAPTDLDATTLTEYRRLGMVGEEVSEVQEPDDVGAPLRTSSPLTLQPTAATATPRPQRGQTGGPRKGNGAKGTAAAPAGSAGVVTTTAPTSTAAVGDPSGEAGDRAVDLVDHKSAASLPGTALPLGPVDGAQVPRPTEGAQAGPEDATLLVPRNAGVLSVAEVKALENIGAPDAVAAAAAGGATSTDPKQ
ncbi:hypothetical protein GT347_16060 [Xylophilus rhododendri]|uniref:Uncharacterized protein n=1 Tax=Xylophilus rhododendri TaxID=2697032 RepID=A0A857J8I9_9BURK|nr:hypothetical protein [Xylophilus rhododendri]QHI99359.1 hypothetical protein GT347_16060 [Xylophilus rhododendri]